MMAVKVPPKDLFRCQITMKTNRVRFQLPFDAKEKLRERHLYPSFIAPVQINAQQRASEAKVKGTKEGDQNITIELDDSSSGMSEATEIYSSKKSSEKQRLPQPGSSSDACAQGEQSNDAVQFSRENCFRKSRDGQEQRKKRRMGENLILRMKHRDLQRRKNQEYANACKKIIKIKQAQLLNFKRHVVQMKVLNDKRHALYEEMQKTVTSCCDANANIRRDVLVQALHFMSSLDSEIMRDQNEIARLSQIQKLEERELEDLQNDVLGLCGGKETAENLPFAECVPEDVPVGVPEDEQPEPMKKSETDLGDSSKTKESAFSESSVADKTENTYSSIFM